MCCTFHSIFYDSMSVSNSTTSLDDKSRRAKEREERRERRKIESAILIGESRENQFIGRKERRICIPERGVLFITTWYLLPTLENLPFLYPHSTTTQTCPPWERPSFDRCFCAACSRLVMITSNQTSLGKHDAPFFFLFSVVKWFYID